MKLKKIHLLKSLLNYPIILCLPSHCLKTQSIATRSESTDNRILFANEDLRHPSNRFVELLAIDKQISGFPNTRVDANALLRFILGETSSKGFSFANRYRALFVFAPFEPLHRLRYTHVHSYTHARTYHVRTYTHSTRAHASRCAYIESFLSRTRRISVLFSRAIGGA